MVCQGLDDMPQGAQRGIDFLGFFQQFASRTTLLHFLAPCEINQGKLSVLVNAIGRLLVEGQSEDRVRPRGVLIEPCVC
jgi:hypothetical protein